MPRITNKFNLLQLLPIYQIDFDMVPRSLSCPSFFRMATNIMHWGDRKDIAVRVAAQQTCMLFVDRH
jgi:hypothetical protein